MRLHRLMSPHCARKLNHISRRGDEARGAFSSPREAAGGAAARYDEAVVSAPPDSAVEALAGLANLFSLGAIAEIGDQTQIATIALAAAYSNLAAVVSGPARTIRQYPRCFSMSVALASAAPLSVSASAPRGRFSRKVPQAAMRKASI